MTFTRATWNCAKVMLALTLPLQVVISSNRPRNTHHFCSRQALEILKRDGLRRQALVLQTHLDAMNQGSLWCDRGFKNISHYYDSLEDTGLWHGPDAPTECRHYFNRAIKKWRQGDYQKASFYLGAASHILQDLCVPHHARGQVFGGHQSFENRARDHYEDFAVHDEGIYDLSDCAGNWVKQNAAFSAVFLPQVKENNDLSVIDDIIDILLKRSQKTTAGFLHFFLRSASS